MASQEAWSGLQAAPVLFGKNHASNLHGQAQSRITQTRHLTVPAADPQTNHNIMSDFNKKGILFKNGKKWRPKHPDLTGEATIDGRKFKVAAWVKQGRR